MNLLCEKSHIILANFKKRIGQRRIVYLTKKKKKKKKKKKESKKEENFFNEGFTFNSINIIRNQIWNLENLCRVLFFFFLMLNYLLLRAQWLTTCLQPPYT